MIILVLILVVAIIAISMAASALWLSVGYSWLFHGNFVDGWHMCWHKPWVLLGMVLLSGLMTGASRLKLSYSR